MESIKEIARRISLIRQEMEAKTAHANKVISVLEKYALEDEQARIAYLRAHKHDQFWMRGDDDDC